MSRGSSNPGEVRVRVRRKNHYVDVVGAGEGDLGGQELS